MQRSILAAICLVVALAAPLAADAGDKQTIHFKITKDGLVTQDIKMEDKRFTLPQGTRLRLVFHYADENRNAHQFTVHSSKTM